MTNVVTNSLKDGGFILINQIINNRANLIRRKFQYHYFYKLYCTVNCDDII